MPQHYTCSMATCYLLLQEGVTAVQQVKQWQFDIMEALQTVQKLQEVKLEPPENSLIEK